MKALFSKSVLHILLTLLVCSSFATSANAQELAKPQSSIQIALGATHNRLIDELFTQNNAKFSGTSFASLISYGRSNSKYIFEAGLNYSKGNVLNQSAEVKVLLYDLRMAIAYQRKLFNHSFFGKKSSFYLGPQFSMLDYVLFDERILENFTLTFNNTFDLKLTEQILLNNNSIYVSLAMPIFGFVKRDASDGGINTNLEDEFENNFFAFLFSDSKAKFLNPLNLPRLNLAYNIEIGEKSDFVLDYQFNFLKNSNRSPINLFANRLLIGIKFEL